MGDEGELPVLNRHLYWVEKGRFQLASDIYDEWVMFLVEAGECRFRIGGAEGCAGPGDVILCPPQVLFEREVLAPVTFHFIGFHVEEGSAVPVGTMRLSKQDRLEDNCGELRKFVHDRSDFSLRLRSHLLNDVWLQILQEHGGTGRAGQEPPDADPLMVKARAYLAEHANESLQLKDVARLFRLTPVQFTRRFHEAVGEKPIDCLTELRLQRACQLLTETDDTIDTIARSCGYENGFYLSRVFTRRMGMNPTVYRKRHRV